LSIATRSDEPRTPIIIMRRRRARGNEKNNKDRKNCGKSDYYPMYMIHYCCVSRGDTFVSSTRCFIASGSLGHVTRRTACRHQYCIIIFGVSDTRLSDYCYYIIIILEIRLRRGLDKYTIISDNFKNPGTN